MNLTVLRKIVRLNPGLELISQIAHTLAGAIVLLLLYVKWGRKGALWGVGIDVVWAATKEFWIDIVYESPELSGMWIGGVKDAAYYLLGTLIAWAWIFWTRWI